MGKLITQPTPGDWVSTIRAIARLDAALNTDSTPTWGGGTVLNDLSVGNDLTVGGSLDLTGTLTLSALDASRLVATNATKELVSSGLINWIADAGSGNVVIADDASGGVTLDTAQDIATGDSPEFVGITLSGLTASRLIATDGSKALASVMDLTAWIAGTVNQVIVADDADGTLTLSTPQDIHTGASPTFANFTDSGLTAGRVTYAGTAGLLTDSANLTFVTDKLSVYKTISCYADANAGGTGISVVNVGNSGLYQGFFTMQYQNAAASGSPYGRLSFQPRKNDDSATFDGGNFQWTKIAGLDSTYFNISTTSGGTGYVGLQQDRGVTIINPDKNSVCDFKINTDNVTSIMYVSASSDQIAFGGSSGRRYAKVTIHGTTEQLRLTYIASIDAAPTHYASFTVNSSGYLTVAPDGAITEFTGAGTFSTTLGVTGMISCNSKCAMTPEGGFVVRLTNQTGGNSVKGQLVKSDTATDDAVILTAASDDECFGVMYEDGIADGEEVWVVVSGIADVAMADNTAATAGNWVETSTEAGYADATNAAPLAAPQHFGEIGHCIETVSAGGAGTHILARCILHFN